MKDRRYCIWLPHMRKVAVNLEGFHMQNLSHEEAEMMMKLMHPNVRRRCEVRPWKSAARINQEKRMN